MELNLPYLNVRLTITTKIPTNGTNYKDRVWIPYPKDEQAHAQKAQNNKFVKSGLENWARMSWIANKVDSSDKNKKINGFQLKKVVHGEIRGDQFLYLYLKYDYKFIS